MICWVAEKARAVAEWYDRSIDRLLWMDKEKEKEVLALGGDLVRS